MREPCDEEEQEQKDEQSQAMGIFHKVVIYRSIGTWASQEEGVEQGGRRRRRRS